jgi:spore germination cell wall hydrolase CwlJ-like protein
MSRILLACLLSLCLIFSNAVRASTAEMDDDWFGVRPVSTATISVDDVTIPLLTKEDRHQIDCLARNMYFEARGESHNGILAVGFVTVNRVNSRLFANTICEVVYQPLQFSWVRGLRHKKIVSKDKFGTILVMAESVYTDYYKTRTMKDIVHGATHFRTVRCRVRWKHLIAVARIDHHIFFKQGEPTRG